MDVVANETPPHSELRTLSRLAAPLALSHAGNQLMSVVDTIMVGPLGTTALAGAGIGNGVYFAVTVFGLGCVLGADPLITQAIGAGETARARHLLDRAIRVAVIVGIPSVFITFLLPSVVRAAGVDAGVAHEVERFLWGRAGHALPFLIFIAQRAYLQAIGHTRPIVWTMVVMNVINVIGNIVLIPRYGVLGSGLASTISGVVGVILMGLALRLVAPRADSGGTDPQATRKIFALGVPLGFQIVAEVGAFTLTGVIAGRLGPVAAASHQIALTLASLSFTCALGVSNATAVRVGYHVGRENSQMARRAGFIGIALAAAVMAVNAGLLSVFSTTLAKVVSRSADPALLASGAALVLIAGVFQLAEGIQTAASGALRGAGDTQAPLWSNVIGYYAIGLPFGAWLGLTRGLGVRGLWWGLCLGLAVVATILVERFRRLSSRPIARA